MKISAVVNTLNEEKNIRQCLESLKWAEEIVVVDMESEDQTVSIAKKLGARVYSHKKTRYVEPARNFAITKATGDWIFILDADEEVPQSLVGVLKKIIQEEGIDFVRIPRQNFIFGKWIKYSYWWPDYNIRFFKKGRVVWSDKIHSIPLTRGKGKDLEPRKANAIIHHHYQSISQYLSRLNRYTDIQAEELAASGYQFSWPDLVRKPIAEFLSRFFAGQGYRDEIHGLVLALLQAFSELVKYLKVWEKQARKEGLADPENFISQLGKELKTKRREFNYWLFSAKSDLEKSFFKRLWLKLQRKKNL
jgi:glycosyltransferase involved in cell wall biosynthesis